MSSGIWNIRLNKTTKKWYFVENKAEWGAHRFVNNRKDIKRSFLSHKRFWWFCHFFKIGLFESYAIVWKSYIMQCHCLKKLCHALNVLFLFEAVWCVKQKREKEGKMISSFPVFFITIIYSVSLLFVFNANFSSHNGKSLRMRYWYSHFLSGRIKKIQLSRGACPFSNNFS